MQVVLTLLPDAVEGIYQGKDGRRDIMPERLRYLHPEAARSFLALDAQHKVRVSDMLRSAEGSLAAKATRRGAARPAYSGHNYGLSIDVDLDVMLHRNGWSKVQLDEFMRSGGWYCYWRNSDSHELEDWHYNFFGDDAHRWLGVCSEERTGLGLEAKINALYGDSFLVGIKQAQFALKSMGFYSGDADDIIGPLTRAGLGAFQRAWGLVDDGQLNIRTQRTIAFLASGRQVV